MLWLNMYFGENGGYMIPMFASEGLQGETRHTARVVEGGPVGPACHHERCFMFMDLDLYDSFMCLNNEPYIDFS